MELGGAFLVLAVGFFCGAFAALGGRAGLVGRLRAAGWVMFGRGAVGWLVTLALALPGPCGGLNRSRRAAPSPRR